MPLADDKSLPPDLRIDPRGGLRAIGAAASRLTAGLADRRGWSAAGLITYWTEIVGADLARRSMPERLVGQGRLSESAARFDTGKGKSKAAPRKPAALRIRVSGAAALEIQHRETEILERVNGYLGYRAVDRLQLVQGGIAPPTVRRAQLPLDAARSKVLAGKVSEIRDPELRAALERLGRSIARTR